MWSPASFGAVERLGGERSGARREGRMLWDGVVKSRGAGEFI